MTPKARRWRKVHARRYLALSLILHLILIAYGEYHDRHIVPKYTDVDYRVFCDAVKAMWSGEEDKRAQGWVVKWTGLKIGECVASASVSQGCMPDVGCHHQSICKGHIPLYSSVSTRLLTYTLHSPPHWQIRHCRCIPRHLLPPCASLSFILPQTHPPNLVIQSFRTQHQHTRISRVNPCCVSPHLSRPS
jgi:hypothetical protein